MRTYLLPLYALLLLALAGPALAVDGVLEINQTCAENTGCFLGDTAGFPVTIAAPGSYRLSSDLVVFGGTVVDILAAAAGASLDLNGFAIRGNTVCTGTPPVCVPTGGSGVGVRINASRVRVANGEISGMRADGVSVFGSDVQVGRV